MTPGSPKSAKPSPLRLTVVNPFDADVHTTADFRSGVAFGSAIAPKDKNGQSGPTPAASAQRGSSTKRRTVTFLPFSVVLRIV